MSTFTDSASQDTDEHLVVFKAVIAAVNFEAIPNLASSIRQERDQQSDMIPGAREQHTVEYIDCMVSSKPLFGSYNILYPIEFADGVRWLIKLPAKGYSGRWMGSDARAITSEVLTMQLVKQKTTIPVPEVFSYQSTIENELCSPYILMKFVEGVSLHEYWFDSSRSPIETELRRRQVLEKVASAVIQLNQFRFHEGGSLLFDDNGHYEIGSMRRVDHQAILEYLQTDEEDEPIATFEVGPLNTQRDFFHCSLDRREAPLDKIGQGFHKFLRLLLAWIPYTDCVEQTPFVLTHPDFDIQNIIVSPDGELRSIIDWDGVAAEPSCLGNERYPSWLTRDWDPMVYGYREPAPIAEEGCPELEDFKQSNAPDVPEEGQPNQDRRENGTIQEEADVAKAPQAMETIKENSPDELNRYRHMYEGFIAALAGQAYDNASRNISDESIILRPERCVRVTRNSLMIENLTIAADNPICTDAILEKIFKEIVRVTKDKYDDDSEDEDAGSVDEDAELEEEEEEEEEENLEDGTEDIRSDVEDSEAVEEGADSVECFDLGGFNLGDVALALVDGELDEARLARLKAGFIALCS